MLTTLHYLVLLLEILIECYPFAKNFQYFIKFNSKKAMCIKYDECEKAKLNEEPIKWINSVKHLGNIITII